MKNTQKSFVTIMLAVLGLLIIGGGVYFYTIPAPIKVSTEDNSSVTPTSKEIEQITPSSKAVISNRLSDEAFIKVSLDPKGKVVARGDINGDGYEDAIVKGSTCGASCSNNLEVVINNKNIDAMVLDVSFEPGFKSSSAAKSDVTNVSIKDGTISLTGYGLDCDNPNQEADICTQEKWSIVKTIKFKLEFINGTSKYHLERVGKSVVITSKVEPTIMILSPNGGEVWKMGSTQSIKWKSSIDLKNKITITINEYIPECYLNGKYVCSAVSVPSAPSTIASDISNTGEYNWVVGSPLVYGGEVRVGKKYKISIIGWPLDNSSAVSDSSDNYFTIVPGNL